MAERVVFFGSGPVAAESLRLLASNFDIEAIITKPSTFAEMANIVESRKYQVENKQQLDELFERENFESRIAVLIDFGIIVSRKVIDSFEYGIVNSHFSLLPEWRGADPISFSILSGQKQTGVSLMLLVEAMDAGPVISVGIQELDGTETTTVLTEKLIHLSDALLKEQVPRYLTGGKGIDQFILHTQIPDYPTEPSYSRKLTKADGEINWNKPASVIEREIRAYQPWPKSHTKLGDIELIITKAHVATDEEAESEDKNILTIKCGRGSLFVEELQPIGKKPMPAKAFLAGYRNRLN